MSKNQLHTDAKTLWIEAWNLSDYRERIKARLDQIGGPYNDDDVNFFESLSEEGVFVYGAILMRILVSRLTPKQAAPWTPLIDELTYAEAAQAASITAQSLHQQTTRLRKRLMRPLK